MVGVILARALLVDGELVEHEGADQAAQLQLVLVRSERPVADDARGQVGD